MDTDRYPDWFKLDPDGPHEKSGGLCVDSYSYVWFCAKDGPLALCGRATAERRAIMIALAYECFKWTGSARVLSQKNLLCNNNLAVPPPNVQGWRRKPHSLREGTCTNADKALRWFWREMCDVKVFMAEHYPSRVPAIVDRYFRAGQQLSSAELACEWIYRFPSDACVAVAVLGVQRT